MSTPAPDSPLARLRADYEERLQADPDRYVDIWEDGSLVARVARSEDIAGARSLMRTLGYILDTNAQVELAAEDLADVVADTTLSLHHLAADGTRHPLLDHDGQPLRFGAAFGRAIGVPEVTTARGAVLVAFQEGEPPSLNALRLMTVATQIAMALTTTSQAAAEASVGEASAPRS